MEELRPSRVTLEERTLELLEETPLLERGVEVEERDTLLLLLLAELLFTELLERETELEERTEEEELLLLLLLFLLPCCTAELLEREELLLERELLLTLEPDRVLDEETEDLELLPELLRLLWLEPLLLRELWLELLLLRELWLEPLLLREELWLELLRELPEERVWATMFSPASMERTRIREVVSVNNLLIASQFNG